jgi:hypothetical protein
MLINEATAIWKWYLKLSLLLQKKDLLYEATQHRVADYILKLWLVSIL